jgi:FkbM family methyltransferase
MSFISYAQNFEDVMLWRALKHIKMGFYIDVGAWSPDIDSVTQAFYEHGWQGINVEPNPEFHVQLLTRRPRDINLRMAVSDKAGSLMMNFFSNLGLSTLDETIVQNHARAGWAIDKHEVQVTTLADLWRQHVPEGQAVHFLKVDVEGFEGAVLRGNDWSKYRPWIVVVEATLPLSQPESHEEWEPMLLTADYHFVYADGLNRFYVADEHVELLPALKYPPNVFDEFKLSSEYQADARAQKAETKAHQLQDVADGLNRELQVVYASRSWRITRPLRAVFCALRRVSIRFPQSNIRGLLSSIPARLTRFAPAHHALKGHALALLPRRPSLEARLRKFAGNNPRDTSIKPSELTPSASRVYLDLKAAIERQNKGGS